MNAKKIVLPRLPQLAPRQKLAEGRVNGGIISAIHAADIPNGALTYALNARCRYDVTGRRPGRTTLTPVKPNAQKVMAIALFKANDATTHFFRFTRNTIHERGVGVWIAYAAGAGGALTGADTDRFQVAIVFNKPFWANGVDKIQYLDTVAATYREAGVNAPKVRYLTGFYNRVIGAYRVEVAQANGPVTLVWSADGDTTKWPDDGAPDPSSGQSPLIESPSDLADFITGVFGFNNVLVITREKSIWVATKQPIASNPFNAQTAIPGVGSDCPNGIITFPGGLAFVDTLSSTIWAYSIGGSIERIGEPIEKDFIRAINDPKGVFGSYDSVSAEGTWVLPLAGSTLLRAWTFNFRTKAWTYDEVDGLSEVSDIDSPFVSTLRFDDLPGTFDSLVGTFDGLVNTQAGGKPARYYGYTDGRILTEDESAVTDDGAAFTMDLQSKEFVAPAVDTYFAEVRLELVSKIAGTVTLYYSRDHGRTWVTAKSITLAPDVSGLLRFTRLIRARSLMWRITAVDGAPNVLSYEVHVQPSGLSRKA